MLTVASSLLADMSYDWVREAGLRELLLTHVWTEIPPLLAGALFPYLVIRLVYRSSLREFGVSWFEPGRPVWGWLGSAVVAVLAGWVIVWISLFALVGWAQPLDASIPSPSDLLALNPLEAVLRKPTARPLAYVWHMFVFVGFAEELLGRGLLQNALDRGYSGRVGTGRCSVRVSTLLAAVLFAIWHIDWLAGSVSGVLSSIAVSLTIVLVPCVLLCLVYEKTRSMFAVILLHNVIDGGKLAVWYIVGHAFVGAGGA